MLDTHTTSKPASSVRKDSQEIADSPRPALPEGVEIKKHKPPAELTPGVPRHPHPLFPTGQQLELTAERDGEVWGKAETHVVTTFIAGENTLEPDTRAILTFLEVRENKRRQHIGATLLFEAEEQAKAMGATRVEGRITAKDPEYLHGPEFLAAHGYTVIHDELGFLYRKPLDEKSKQGRGEIVDIRSLEEEPELGEREKYLQTIKSRAKIVPHDEYYRLVDAGDLQFADIGAAIYRWENRTAEGILINADNLKYAWGDDFTYLMDVILEEKAVELWLTKDLSPNDHEGHADAHRQAVAAAVEKAHADGVLGDLLTLRTRQLHTFAEYRNPQAMDELALYENAAMKIKETADGDIVREETAAQMYSILTEEGISINVFPPGMQKSQELVQASLNLFGFILPDNDIRWNLAYALKEVPGKVSRLNRKNAIEATYLSSATSKSNGGESVMTELNLRNTARAIQNLRARTMLEERFQATEDAILSPNVEVRFQMTERIMQDPTGKPDPSGITPCPEALYQLVFFYNNDYLARIGFNIHQEQGEYIASIANVQGKKDGLEAMLQVQETHGVNPFNLLVQKLKAMTTADPESVIALRGVRNPKKGTNAGLYNSLFRKEGIARLHRPLNSTEIY